MTEFHIRGSEKILAIIRNFSTTEKVLFGILTIVALTTALMLAWGVNKAFLIAIPTHGGKLTEGVVGLPRSINPVLAFTDVDLDLSNLVYSGLMKYNGGKLVLDIAEGYSISDDGRIYTFKIRDDVRFHDGKSLTTDDVEFTIQKIQDSIIKSPRRADWANITTKKINATEIQFILRQPYAPFLANTTIGILPKHIWSKISPEQFIYSQYNIEPIGTGPYELRKITRDNGGIPTSYSFKSYTQYHANEPYISEISLFFFPNEKALIEAFNRGSIESIARISAHEAARVASTTRTTRILHIPLPRIFGIFFNQNQASVFLHNEVRQALNIATDKEEIIKKVLYGYGIAGNGPIPDEPNIANKLIDNPTPPTSSANNITRAREILLKAGWEINTDGIMEKRDPKTKSVKLLEFAIATVDAPDLKATADIIKTQWAKVGAKVTIQVFDYGDLYQNVISPRKYDALLFGESIGKDLDLYAFWHSSQRNSPGLNVAMYANHKVDKILEEARITSDIDERRKLYRAFENIIEDEVPAVFLYSPEFIYVVPNKIQGMKLEYITSSSDRFYGINNWYIATENVWKIFGEKQSAPTTINK